MVAAAAFKSSITTNSSRNNSTDYMCCGLSMTGDSQRHLFVIKRKQASDILDAIRTMGRRNGCPPHRSARLGGRITFQAHSTTFETKIFDFSLHRCCHSVDSAGASRVFIVYSAGRQVVVVASSTTCQWRMTAACDPQRPRPPPLLLLLVRQQVAHSTYSTHLQRAVRVCGGSTMVLAAASSN